MAIWFTYNFAMEPLIGHAKKMGESMGFLEPFLGICNSELLFSIIPVIFLCMIGDFPMEDGNTDFFLPRVGRYRWLFGQMVFQAEAVLTYLVSMFLATQVLCGEYLSYTGEWSSVVTKYYMAYPEEQMDMASRLLTDRLYNNFTPQMACLHTFCLFFCYLTLLGMIKMCFFLWNNKLLGLVASGSVIAVGGALAHVSTGAKWLFPTANALEWMHCDRVLGIREVTMGQSYLYFLILIGVLTIICVCRIDAYAFTDKQK